MIVGEGYFKVLKPDGSFGYTRDGSFKKDATGLIVNSNGYPLVPQITVPEGATQITIGQERNRRGDDSWQRDPNQT